jgi:hypothetical protein
VKVTLWNRVSVKVLPESLQVQADSGDVLGWDERCKVVAMPMDADVGCCSPVIILWEGDRLVPEHNRFRGSR